MPELLLTGQLLLAGLLASALWRDRLRPRDLGLGGAPGGGRLAAHAGLGLAAGSALAAAYLWLLAPALEFDPDGPRTRT